jgi:hypothetical protein
MHYQTANTVGPVFVLVTALNEPSIGLPQLGRRHYLTWRISDEITG